MAERAKNQPLEFRKITVLRYLREKAGLSREQLVARLDNRIAVRTLQRWETLGKEPALTRGDWIDLCNALNVHWEELPRDLSDFVEETETRYSEMVACS